MTREERAFNIVDRSRFGPGPWDDEPDKVDWIDPASALACRIERPPLGHLCGYVGLPPKHPWSVRDYDSIEPHPDVHGGLTFSDRKPGSDLFWVGFDCAHVGDVVPGLRRRPVSVTNSYKTIAWVQAECARLAAAVSEAAQ